MIALLFYIVFLNLLTTTG